MNRKLTIFFLLISIIALMYMFLSYYGIIRYGNMYRSPLENYSTNYTKLPILDKQRVIVAFKLNIEPDSPKNLTLDKELNLIKPFLNSILDQSVRVNDIALILPSEYSEMANKLPKKYSFISRYFTSVDYGESSCLITSVLREKEADTKIILVSPSMIYGRDFIETMVEESNSHADCIVYGRYSDWRQGILVKPSFFTDTISNCNNSGQKSCRNWIHTCSDAQVHDCRYGETFKAL